MHGLLHRGGRHSNTVLNIHAANCQYQFKSLFLPSSALVERLSIQWRVHSSAAEARSVCTLTFHEASEERPAVGEKLDIGSRLLVQREDIPKVGCLPLS